MSRAIAACLRGFADNKGEAGSAGLDSGGLAFDTTVSIQATPNGTRYQLIKPKHSNTTHPSCIAIHVFGGGFVAGSPTQYLPLTSQLVQKNARGGRVGECWMAVPFYSLNAYYPVPLNQVLAVARALRRDHARARLVIGGDSAGGTIACGAALRAPRLFDGMYLYSPWLNLDSDLKTYSSRAFCPAVTGAQGTRASTGDPIFTTSAAKNSASSRALAMHYLGTKSRFADPYANPSRATGRMLARLPPVLVFVGDRETVLGGSERFMGKLQALGRTEDALQVYSGMWHVFAMYSQGCGSGERLAQADAVLSQTRSFIRGAAPRSLAPAHLPSVDAKLVMLPLPLRSPGQKRNTRRRRRTRRPKTSRQGSSTRRRKAKASPRH